MPTFVFYSTIGEDAYYIYEELELDNEEEEENLEVVISDSEECFVGETHEAYNFHIRKQEASECTEAYVAALRQLAKSCNLGEMQDRLIPDQIVIGLKVDTVRKKVFKE